MRILSIVLCLWLTGCGFALRGPVEVPANMQIIAITPDDPYRPLQRTLRQELSFSGVQTTNTLSEGQVILRLDNEAVGRYTLAVGTDGDVIQERLTYKIGFELVDKENKVLIPKQVIETDRVLYINQTQLLGVNREEKVLIEDMRKESVQQLIRRLAAYQ